MLKFICRIIVKKPNFAKMMEYDFNKIEADWQNYWATNKVYAAKNGSEKPKFYVLDMFPYPSGAGLHVGHPLGYIASDIYARYKRHQGFNVLHPMGYDSFGLPAEQYAIQTGQHPAITTETNVKRYREQLDKLGFSFDWDREVRTSDPNYYKWTQWIFIQLFNSWYNLTTDKAEPIQNLISIFEKEGNINVSAVCDESNQFSAPEWQSFSEQQQQTILLNYRLAFLSEAMVNWCPQLGTVLANDEVKDGLSERGGYPVVQKKMKQWSMRITAYAQRLLDGLNHIDWSDSLKEMQRNWIGKSEGASIHFKLANSNKTIEVFTTRPDTIFGVTYMTLAPEHELVAEITTSAQKEAVDKYIEASAKRSERDRMSDVKTISGVFTGAYAVHPFSGEKIQIWIGDYVLAGYGTGAVMAVPAHDSRDYAFAKHFQLPIKQVVDGGDISEQSYDAKEGTLINSDFLNGLQVKEAIKKAIKLIEEKQLGKGKTNYKLRDAVFGRQRYWGEPIPIYYKNNIPYVVDIADLPISLPEVDAYLPTEDGEPPLARATNWKYKGQYPYELSTMPGWAGSSWYFLRYMDATNNNEFVSKEAVNYWKEIDLYIGGAEHATGHLLYFRFWTKFLYDLGLIPFDEPAKKLINQGMIQGVSAITSLNELYPVSEEKILKAFGEASIVGTGSKDECGNESKTKSNIHWIFGVGYQVLWGDSQVVQGFFSSSLRAGEKKDFKTHEFKYSKTIPLKYIDESDNSLKIKEFINSIEGKEYFDAAFFTEKGYWRKGEFYNYQDVNNTIAYSEFKDEEFDISKASDKFFVNREVEKMSKSKFNVVNPDELVARYGADTLRLYEMFLGPLEQHKPWDTKGIEGTHRFLRKAWRLYHDANNEVCISDEEPSKKAWKTLHKTIKKITADIERYSFNTPVSELMICVNELTELKCNNRAILEPFAVLLSPYAPHIAEELWLRLGHQESITYQPFPVFDESFLVEDSFSYPVSFNGKMRFTLELPASLTKEEIETEVMSHDLAIKWLEGKDPKKIIVVPKKIVNIVV
jgi:leucyl-tRNA synthetase